MRFNTLAHAGLLPIIKYNAYYDTKSIDRFVVTRQRPKPKYKLAGNKILESYFFYVLTTNDSACKKSVTATIEQSHWENKTEERFLNDISFCDVRKYEHISKDDLSNKIRDPNNGFKCAAKLCSLKCNEIEELCKKALEFPDEIISEETKRVIKEGIFDLDGTLSRLKLN